MTRPIIKPISAEDRRRWAEQNLADLLAFANLSFADKIRQLEQMEEVARALHGGNLPPSPDEHAEQA